MFGATISSCNLLGVFIPELWSVGYALHVAQHVQLRTHDSSVVVFGQTGSGCWPANIHLAENTHVVQVWPKNSFCACESRNSSITAVVVALPASILWVTAAHGGCVMHGGLTLHFYRICYLIGVACRAKACACGCRCLGDCPGACTVREGMVMASALCCTFPLPSLYLWAQLPVWLGLLIQGEARHLLLACMLN